LFLIPYRDSIIDPATLFEIFYLDYAYPGIVKIISDNPLSIHQVPVGRGQNPSGALLKSKGSRVRRVMRTCPGMIIPGCSQQENQKKSRK
jgi:hypothetical protein